MSKKLKELKEWAAENVTLVDLLPPNDNLQVTTRLIDVLEDEVDEKYYLSEEKTKKLTLDYDLSDDIEPMINFLGNTSNTGYRAHNVHAVKGLIPTLAVRDYKGPKQIAVREATKQGYAIEEQGDSVNYTYPTSKTRRGRVGKQVAQTLQAGEVNQGVVTKEIGLIQPKDREYKNKGKKREETIELSKENISPSLRSGIQAERVIENRSLIRKLTPLECWRLQGFTDEQFHKAKDSGVSKSQLYKQAGNSVTVNVVDAIVKQLKE